MITEPDLNNYIHCSNVILFVKVMQNFVEMCLYNYLLHLSKLLLLLGKVHPRSWPQRIMGQILSVRGHLEISNVSESDIRRPGSVITRGHRTLRDLKDPQLFSKEFGDRK